MKPYFSQMSRSTFNNQNQNLGNAIKLDGTTNVKVHAPPGGASSFSFGWGSEPAPVVQRTGRRRIDQGGSTVPLSPSKDVSSNSGFSSRNQPSISRQIESELQSSTMADNSQHISVTNAHEINSVTAQQTRVSSNAYATGSNQNAGNVLTERPIVRRYFPAGGASSIVLG
jgi:SPIRAL1-like protein